MKRSGPPLQGRLTWVMVGVSAVLHALALPWGAALLDFQGPPALRVRLRIEPAGEARAARLAGKAANPQRPEGAPDPPPGAAREARRPASRLEAAPPAPTLLRDLATAKAKRPDIPPPRLSRAGPQKPPPAPGKIAAPPPRVSRGSGPTEAPPAAEPPPPPLRAARMVDFSISAADTAGAGAALNGLSRSSRTEHGQSAAVSPAGIRVLKKTLPPYPPDARRRGEEGSVLLRVEVLPDGRVGRVLLAQSSGFGSLDRAAAESAASWRFAFEGGRPARSAWAQIPVRFRIIEP
ncbi:MAG: TonB family protein [Candidatus Tectomicrobia bacterium]|nr:TonB family protein [Candidatus Tectomicrobia bacterium]